MLQEMAFEEKFISDAECIDMIQYFDENRNRVYRSKVGYSPNRRVNLNQRISHSLSLHYSNEKYNHIFKKVFDYIYDVNRESFGFDVDWEGMKTKTEDMRFVQEDNIWICEYRGDEKGFYGKNQKVNWISNSSQFKIYASIVLSGTNDYEGGDLIYYFGKHTDQPTPVMRRERGFFHCFPAFRYSEVKPVLSGRKLQLEFLLEGPCWR